MEKTLDKYTEKELNKLHRELSKEQKINPTFERSFRLMQISDELHHRYLVRLFNEEHGIKPPASP